LLSSSDAFGRVMYSYKVRCGFRQMV